MAIGQLQRPGTIKPLKDEKLSVSIVEVPISVKPYGRVTLIRDRLEEQLDKFKRSRALQRHPALLRQPVEQAISKPFQRPRVRFYIVTNEEKPCSKELFKMCIDFMNTNGFCPSGEPELRRVPADLSSDSDSDPMIHITLLESKATMEYAVSTITTVITLQLKLK